MEIDQLSDDNYKDLLHSTTLLPLTSEDSKKFVEFLKNWKNMSSNEFEESVLSLVKIDPTRLFSCINEYLSLKNEEDKTTDIINTKDLFMKKLLQSKPCCYFTRFWKLYLNFTLENREILFSTKSSLALTETSSIESEILNRFETALTLLPTSWSLTELFLKHLKPETQHSESTLLKIYNKLRLNVGAHVRSTPLWLSLLRLFLNTKKFDELIETLELMCIMPLVFEEKDTLSQFFQDPRLLESQRLQERLPEFTERLLRQEVNEIVNSRQMFYSSLCTLRDKQHFVSLFESDIQSAELEFQSEIWLSKMYELWFKEIECLEQYVGTLSSNDQKRLFQSGLDPVCFTLRKLFNKLRKYPSQTDRMLETIQLYTARLNQLIHEQDTSTGCAHPHFTEEILELKNFLTDKDRAVQNTYSSNPKFYLSLAAVELCLYGPAYPEDRSFSDAFRSSQSILEEALNSNENWQKYPEPSLVLALVNNEILFDDSPTVLNKVCPRFEQTIQKYIESLQQESVPEIRERAINDLIDLWSHYTGIEIQFEQYNTAIQLYQRALKLSEIASLPSLWRSYINLLLSFDKPKVINHIYLRALKSVEEKYKNELWQEYLNFYQEKFEANITLEDLQKKSDDKNEISEDTEVSALLTEIVDKDLNKQSSSEEPHVVVPTQNDDKEKSTTLTSQKKNGEANENQFQTQTHLKEHSTKTTSSDSQQSSSNHTEAKKVSTTATDARNTLTRRPVFSSHTQLRKRTKNLYGGPPTKRLHVGPSPFLPPKPFPQFSLPLSPLKFTPHPSYSARPLFFQQPPINKVFQVFTSQPRTRSFTAQQRQPFTPSGLSIQRQETFSNPIRPTLPGLRSQAALHNKKGGPTSFKNVNSFLFGLPNQNQQNRMNQVIALLEQLLNQTNVSSNVTNSNQSVTSQAQLNAQLLKTVQYLLQQLVQQQQQQKQQLSASSSSFSQPSTNNLQPTTTTIQSNSAGNSSTPRPFLVPSKPTSSIQKETITNRTNKNRKQQTNVNLSTPYTSWKHLPPNTFEIAPDVPFHYLLQLDDFLKDNTIFEVIKSLRRILNLKEQEIKQRRELLFQQQNEKKKILNLIHKMRLKSPGTEKYALIQAQNEKEYREQERICKEEIDHFEKQISEELDKEAAEQQVILQRAGVPGIFTTINLDEIHVQSQILELIMSMMNRTPFTEMGQSLPTQYPQSHLPSASLSLTQHPQQLQPPTNVFTGFQFQRPLQPPVTTTTTTGTTKTNPSNSTLEFRASTQISSQNYPNFYQQPTAQQQQFYLSQQQQQQQQQQQPSQTAFPQYSQHPYTLYPFYSSTCYQQPTTSMYSTPYSSSSMSTVQQQPGQNLGSTYWTNSQYSEWRRYQ